MMKLYRQSDAASLGRAPTHRAICHRKTPSPNLLLILITNRKSYGCASGASCAMPGGAARQEPQGGYRCCSHILIVDSRRGSCFIPVSSLQVDW